MLSPKMEKALLQTSRDAWASFHALALPEDAMLCIAETFRPLIADLEAKAQTARAEALEEAAKVCEREAKAYRDNGAECERCGNWQGQLNDEHGASGCDLCADAIRVLASTDPTGEKI